MKLLVSIVFFASFAASVSAATPPAGFAYAWQAGGIIPCASTQWHLIGFQIGPQEFGFEINPGYGINSMSYSWTMADEQGQIASYSYPGGPDGSDFKTSRVPIGEVSFTIYGQFNSFICNSGFSDNVSPVGIQVDSTSNKYIIKNKASGLVLQVPTSCSGCNGARIEQDAYTGATTQQWHFYGHEYGDDATNIINQSSSQLWTIANYGLNNQAVYQDPAIAPPNQLPQFWTFVAAGNGYYYIRVQGDMGSYYRVVSVVGGSKANGAQLVTEDRQKTDSEMWEVDVY